MLSDDRQAAPFLEKMLRVLPGIVYVFNQTTQSNEYANRSLGDVLGYGPAEVQEMGSALFPTLCHPDDLPKIGAHFQAIQSMGDDEVLSVEYRMRHKDGEWRWLLSHDAVYERDETGALLRHIGKATDITDLKRQEAVFAAGREELEVIFNAASSGIVAFNSEGQVARVNEHARHMLGGLSDPAPFEWPEEISFLDSETLQPLEASADPVRRALAGHALQSETHLLRRTKDGPERRYVRIDTATVNHEASGINLVLVIDDVSNEERNRQVVERKSRLDALGQLTGGIAHDFNNLLASMLYAVDLAGNADNEAERKEYLETAASSVERGRALASRLLAFARTQPGLASVKKTVDVCESFRTLIRPMIEAHIEIRLEVEDAELRHYCDQNQLENALMNLVLNARDAMLRSGRGNRIDISARAVRASSPDLDGKQRGHDRSGEIPRPGAGGESFRYVEISVADNGPGMDDETLARCTDPFFTTKETGAGTGLGLAMIYGFVSQSDGDLRIYSEVGVGTTVQMTLPRGTERGVREEAVPEADVEKGGGQTLLVVEDEPQLLQMITSVLGRLGYVVVTATSGQEALSLVEGGEAFDLLLTDVVMPGKIGGFELARRVRALRPDIPVIYTSGYTGFTASEMGEVQAPLLQKPAPPSELAEVIAAALADA